jgi:retron-type reverse transcriptase
MRYRVPVRSFGKKLRKREKVYMKKFYILKTLKSKLKGISSNKRFQFSKYITVWNFDIEKCFDNINHQTIVKLTPLCDKYLFFLKQWLIAPIIGPQKKGSKISVSIKPRSGIPQGSILGPGICNLVLDGIDDLLLRLKRNGKIASKCFLNNKAKSFLDKLAISKPITKNHYNPKTDISYLRYADDIIFYGFHNKETFLLIQNEITKFLEDRGLSIKPSTNTIFQFKPNSAFSFLGFRYFFPSRFHKKKLNKGKFTKKRYTPFNIAENRLNENLRSRIIITIDQNALKRFKTRIRKIFKKGHFYLSVAQLIDILNEKIRGFASYFSYSEKIRIQLNSLDYSIRN